MSGPDFGSLSENGKAAVQKISDPDQAELLSAPGQPY
jgi:hypothetical protein